MTVFEDNKYFIKPYQSTPKWFLIYFCMSCIFFLALNRTLQLFFALLLYLMHAFSLSHLTTVKLHSFITDQSLKSSLNIGIKMLMKPSTKLRLPKYWFFLLFIFWKNDTEEWRFSRSRASSNRKIRKSEKKLS